MRGWNQEGSVQSIAYTRIGQSIRCQRCVRLCDQDELEVIPREGIRDSSRSSVSRSKFARVLCRSLCVSAETLSDVAISSKQPFSDYFRIQEDRDPVNIFRIKAWAAKLCPFKPTGIYVTTRFFHAAWSGDLKQLDALSQQEHIMVQDIKPWEFRCEVDEGFGKVRLHALDFAVATMQINASTFDLGVWRRIFAQPGPLSLCLAVSNNQIDLVKVLLKSGADVTIDRFNPDNIGHPPLPDPTPYYHGF